ncbi:MAG: EF-hand domain-containing protein [Bacteroidales bacterium]
MRLTPCLFALLVPVAALAQTGEGKSPAGPAPSAQVRRMMTEMDTDHDGFVSREEFLAAHARADKMFEQLDSNHDGAISRDEFMAGHGGQGRAERFRVLDTNGDGRITREELDARRNARFDALDTNKDGKLSPQELRSAQNAMRRDALDPNAR